MKDDKKGFLKFFQTLCKFNFGLFEKEEFKKFIRLGVIFILIIGVYWTLRSLKDSIFISLVSRYHLPFAKTISVLALLPLVIFYTRLLEKTSREKMLHILPTFYGIAIFLFSFLMVYIQPNLDKLVSGSKFIHALIIGLAYLWYLFVESFGSLVVALFWAYSADTTEPTSARRGFPLIYAFGQIGGIVFPRLFGGLPFRLGLKTDFLSMIILGILTLSIIPMFKSFLKRTPKKMLESFHAKNLKEEEKKHEPGFFEGLRLILKHKYLLSIFAVNFIYEVIVTIFDFNFKIAASSIYSGVALTKYLSDYGSTVNTVSLICLLLGISNITRFLGVGVALSLMPIIIGSALFGFLTIDSLTFLFILMVGSKAINYALNGPALKQLYVPTTPDVKFKSQAWIETFGSRSSKQSGSVFNMMLAPLQKKFGAIAGKSYYLYLSGLICFPLLTLWLVIAIFLGRKFKKAINEKKVVC